MTTGWSILPMVGPVSDLHEVAGASVAAQTASAKSRVVATLSFRYLPL
ncbi:MAG TPA: hypothetical protein VKB09_10820 [Thermomicrobiales bacterium]|nr:hypothetical protein [Thermomicrobiales bacterium]